MVRHAICWCANIMFCLVLPVWNHQMASHNTCTRLHLAWQRAHNNFVFSFQSKVEYCALELQLSLITPGVYSSSCVCQCTVLQNCGYIRKIYSKMIVISLFMRKCESAHACTACICGIQTNRQTTTCKTTVNMRSFWCGHTECAGKLT